MTEEMIVLFSLEKWNKSVNNVPPNIKVIKYS